MMVNADHADFLPGEQAQGERLINITGHHVPNNAGQGEDFDLGYVGFWPALTFSLGQSAAGSTWVFGIAFYEDAAHTIFVGGFPYVMFNGAMNDSVPVLGNYAVAAIEPDGIGDTCTIGLTVHTQRTAGRMHRDMSNQYIINGTTGALAVGASIVFTSAGAVWLPGRVVFTVLTSQGTWQAGLQMLEPGGAVWKNAVVLSTGNTLETAKSITASVLGAPLRVSVVNTGTTIITVDVLVTPEWVD